MKGLLTYILIGMFPFLSAYSMGESSSFGKIDANAGDAYVKLAKVSFQKLISDYNKSRRGAKQISNSLKKSKDREALEKFLAKNKINQLPPIRQVNTKAYIAMGKNVIVFSILSVRRGEFYFNDQLVKFDGSDLSEKEKIYSLLIAKKKPKFSLFSLLISDVYAESGVSEELDILLVATMMKLTKDFEDRGMCAMCGDENKEQMKTNFDKMISNMESMADKCEDQGYMSYTDDSEVGRLAHSLNEIQEYNPKISDDSELNQIIDEKFKAIESDTQKENLTCGQLAFSANFDEITTKFPELSNRKKNVFASYVGSTSAGVDEDKRGLSQYLNKKCEAHSRLLNCLATNSDYGRGVYNRSAGRDEYKRITIGKDIEEGYRHHSISK